LKNYQHRLNSAGRRHFTPPLAGTDGVIATAHGDLIVELIEIDDLGLGNGRRGQNFRVLQRPELDHFVDEVHLVGISFIALLELLHEIKQGLYLTGILTGLSCEVQTRPARTVELTLLLPNQNICGRLTRGLLFCVWHERYIHGYPDIWISIFSKAYVNISHNKVRIYNCGDVAILRCTGNAVAERAKNSSCT
jgi:hypothetical protein